jgi:hypothetical protein
MPNDDCMERARRVIDGWDKQWYRDLQAAIAQAIADAVGEERERLRPVLSRLVPTDANYPASEDEYEDRGGGSFTCTMAQGDGDVEFVRRWLRGDPDAQ